jgi:hypothetical protein
MLAKAVASHPRLTLSPLGSAGSSGLGAKATKALKRGSSKDTLVPCGAVEKSHTAPASIMVGAVPAECPAITARLTSARPASPRAAGPAAPSIDVSRRPSWVRVCEASAGRLNHIGLYCAQTCTSAIPTAAQAARCSLAVGQRVYSPLFPGSTQWPTTDI